MRTSLPRSLPSLMVVLFCLPQALLGAPPDISSQPTNQTVAVGGTAVFSVTASGTPPLSYQWQFNGTNLVGGTNTSLTLTNVQLANAGPYSVTVSNRFGTTISSNAVLTVLVVPPSIVSQPTDQGVWAGSNATFSVAASGTLPLRYQWQFNGTNINGSTNTSLTLTNVQVAQAGNYAAQVTNAAGSVLSSNAVLTVMKSGPVLVCDEVDLQAAVAAGGTITFDCDGVITLTKTLAVTKPTTLDGTGHTVTISGGNAVQLFSVSSGVNASFINLTLANGCAAGSNGVAGPPVTDGQPGMGGAILNNGGTVALTSCTVVSNLAVGGAGYTNCIDPTNSAGGVALGGAVYNLAGNVSVTNCNFSANGVTGGTGGHNLGYSGAGGDACGGAIYSSGGSVTVQNSTFLSHTAQGGTPGQGPAVFYGLGGSAFGGVIYSSSATLNFNNSTFTSNSATGAGASWWGSGGWGCGGVIFAQSGVVNCIGCSFTTNTVAGGGAYKTYAGSGWGGAICSYASLSVSQSSFWGNQSSGSTGYTMGEGSGGAIFNGNSLALSGSAFVQNAAQGGVGGWIMTAPLNGGMGKGGAICNMGTLTTTNCTLVANDAKGGDVAFIGGYYGASGGDGTGGGLFNTNGTATLVNLTFASNNAVGGAGDHYGSAGLSSGGAIYNTNGTANLYNTIMAYSTSSSDCWGTVLDYGHNLSSDNSAGFYMPGSLNNTDPVLGPLDDYGGPTLTMALLSGSPAIDGGNAATAPATDQRGRSRPYGSAADIGAFESSAPFIVKGNLVGATGVVTFSAGTTNVAVTNSGVFWFRTLLAGSYVITPSNANYVFVPNSRSYTLGPDWLDANFKAYSWNTINLEGLSNATLQLRYAGTNGQNYRVLTTTNLTGQWLPAATNYLSASNYFDVFLPLTTEPGRFYRTVSP